MPSSCASSLQFRSPMASHRTLTSTKCVRSLCTGTSSSLSKWCLAVPGLNRCALCRPSATRLTRGSLRLPLSRSVTDGCNRHNTRWFPLLECVADIPSSWCCPGLDTGPRVRAQCDLRSCDGSLLACTAIQRVHTIKSHRCKISLKDRRWKTIEMACISLAYVRNFLPLSRTTLSR